MSIFDSYQKRFEQHLQEEYTLQEYLDLCKQDPLVYATAAERMLAAIGEPELIDTSQDTAPFAYLFEQADRALPGLFRVLRHGGFDRANRVLFQACRAGPRGKEADSLPARPGGRRQVIARRSPQAADGANPDLRDQGFAGVRIAAGAVRRQRGCRNPASRITASRGAT